MGFVDGDHWDNIAEAYSMQRRFSKVDRKVFEILKEDRASLIVEIGCGTGIFAEYLIENYPTDFRYIGTDISSKFIEITRDRLKRFSHKDISIILTEPEKLILNESSADAIVAMAVLHHMPLDSIKNALNNFRKILKPLGCFILVEDWAFTPSSEIEVAASSLRERLKEYEGIVENHMPDFRWALLLQDVGFKIEIKTSAYRPLSFERFRVLNDEKSKSYLQLLDTIQEDKKKIPMIIFVCSNEKMDIA